MFTLVNDDGVTYSYTSLGTMVTKPPQGGESSTIGYVERAAPYTVTAGFDVIAVPDDSGASILVGLGFYDGTKLFFVSLRMTSDGVLQYLVCKQDTLTGSTGAAGDAAAALFVTPIKLRIENDETDLIFSIGNGTDFTEIYREAVGSYMTPDSFCWVVNNFQNDNETVIRFGHFQIS